MSQENKTYILKENTIGYRIPIELILIILGVGEVLEIFIAQSKMIYTDIYVIPTSISFLNALPPALRNQNAYLGFIYWMLTTTSLRVFGYIVSENVFLSNIKNKTLFVIAEIVIMSFIIVDTIKLAYFTLVLFTCADYGFCRGRNFTGIASLEFWYIYGNTIAHILLGLLLLLANVLLVKSLNPKVNAMLVSMKMHYNNVKNSLVYDIYGHH